MKIDAALAVARRRLRTEAALRVAYRGATGGSVAVILALLASRVFPGYPHGPWLLAIPAATFLLGFAAGYVRRRPSPDEAAAALDVRLALRERVSTARYVAIAHDGPEDAAEFIASQAQRCLDRTTKTDVKRAFRLPRDVAPGAAFGAMLLAFVALPWLPMRAVAAPNPEVEARRDAAEQARRVKESARRLEERAKELERAAEMRKLEEARRLARELRTEANRMATSPPQLKDALKSLAKLELAVKKAQADAFGLENADALGDEASQRLSELARELDQLDPRGLSLDLDAFKKQLGSEADRSAANGTNPNVDQRALRDLMRRFQDMKDQLEALEAAAREMPEYASLSQEQSEMLEKLMQALQQLERRLGEANASGRPLTAEELKQLLDKLASMSPEELEKLLQALREADALEILKRAIGECRGGCSGGLGGKMGLSDAQLNAMLARLAAGRSGANQGQGSGSNPNQSGSGMGGPGQGAGGQASRAPDDGHGEEPERVHGQLDPTGRLGRGVPFQGLPNPAEAKREFDETIGRAAADAEEGLGKDLLPPDARAYVRRYFEALRDQK